jgi:GTPase Era involved in 16S rRNA processing
LQFINKATGQESVTVGHDLFSVDQEVCAISYPYPDDSGRNIVFLDTPGFDDSSRADYDILDSISKWLKKT